MPIKSKRLNSGYTVKVRGVGPFSFTHLNLKYPRLDPPVRVITLATGDEGEWPYKPPEDEPDKADREEWELWVRYQTWLHRAPIRLQRLDAERVEFFKLHCIDIRLSLRLPLLALFVILYKWFARRLTGSVSTIPFKQRYLQFLDTEVIQSVDTWNWIENAAYAKEVTEADILDIARTFQREMGGETAHTGTPTGTAARGAESVQHADMGSASGASGGVEGVGVV